MLIQAAVSLLALAPLSHAKQTALTQQQLENAEAAINLALEETAEPWRIVKGQAFLASFKNKGFSKVVFAVARQSESIRPFPRAFVLDPTGGKVLSPLPEFAERYDTWADHKEILAVGFPDLNRDGYKDVVIIDRVTDRRPSQGEGIGNAEKSDLAFAFLNDRKTGFVLDTRPCLDATTVSAVQKCFQAKKK